jgi:eukaryotic-like serine/threonine-protein kinase
MQIGEKVQEQYQIERILGQGSMGTTYRALELETGRPVAIKQLHVSRIQGWKALEMFEREATILKHLSHPRVPSYIDYFSQETQEGKQFLLVQEYVEGKTLKQLVEEGWRGTEQDILDIFIDLVDILAALHTLRPPVIHRDLNPKNIIISPNNDVYPRLNEVYLVDFGAVQDQMRTTFLGGSTIIGTFGYIPFEQFSGQTVPASDYYALGATLLYMLTHRHPSDFPADELKPQFEPFLHGSKSMLRLLQGLLEPSAKNRVASPEDIQRILDEYGPSDFEFSANRLKPADTKIEKHVDGPYDMSFRIPAQKVGLVVKRNILRLTPEHVQAHEEMLGIRSGELWRIPTGELQGSDLTWFFSNGNGSKKKHSILGINYGGETFKIADRLQKDEIHW